MPALRLLVWLVCTALAAGESTPGRVETALIVPDAPGGSTSVEVAASFDIAAGTHLYWLNPGDSGLPPRLHWTLPEGWTADPPRFPAPERHAADGLVTFIHSGRLLLLCTLRGPAMVAGSYPLRVRADWLACDAEACLPGSAILVGELRIAAGPVASSTASASLVAARMTLPIPDNTVTAQHEGAMVILRLPASTAEPVIFPAEDSFRTDLGVAVPNASGWQVRVPLTSATSVPARFTGVARLGGRTIAIDTPITRSQP